MVTFDRAGSVLFGIERRPGDRSHGAISEQGIEFGSSMESIMYAYSHACHTHMHIHNTCAARIQLEELSNNARLSFY